MTKMLNGLAGVLLALVATTSASAAAEITVWTASAFAKVLHQIGPQFEAGTGNNLNISEGLRDAFIKRIDAGESFDVLILPAPQLIDALIKQDKISFCAKSRLMHCSKKAPSRTTISVRSPA